MLLLRTLLARDSIPQPAYSPARLENVVSLVLCSWELRKEIFWILPFRATIRLKIHLNMNTSRQIYTQEVPLEIGFK